MAVLLYGSVCAMLAAALLYRFQLGYWPILLEKFILEIRYNLLANKEIILDHLYAKSNVKITASQMGRVAIITGGARGIGFEVVKMLLKLDMEVIIACRSIGAGDGAIYKIRESGIESGRAKVYQLDNASLASVKKFAAQIKQDYTAIHLLINNAGVMFRPYQETEDGYEEHWAVNYLAHFLLTALLMPLLDAGSLSGRASRVVNVSSCAHLLGRIDFNDTNCKERFISSAAYAQSKLAQVVMTIKLQDFLKEKNCNVQVFSVHPGIVNTDLFEHSYIRLIQPILSLVLKSPEEGAIPIVYTALHSKLEEQGGAYISNCRITAIHGPALDSLTQDKLFLLSLKQVGLSDFWQGNDNALARNPRT